MKVVNILDSDLMMGDRDFVNDYCKHNGITIEEDLTDEQCEEIDTEKYEYYSGDFRFDCDVIRMGDQTYSFAKVGDEILMIDEVRDDKIEKILLHYFSKQRNDKSITPEFDRGDWNAKLLNGDECDTRIKYR